MYTSCPARSHICTLTAGKISAVVAAAAADDDEDNDDDVDVNDGDGDKNDDDDDDNADGMLKGRSCMS